MIPAARRPDDLYPAGAAQWLRTHAGVVVSESTVRRALERAQRDGQTDSRGRVLAGDWQGAYRRGRTWRVPLQTLRAQVGQVEQGRLEAQLLELAQRIERLEGKWLALLALAQEEHPR